jgi:hypothetical protein
MKFTVTWWGHYPGVDLADPQQATALLRAVYDAVEHVEPLTEFRFELAGIRCLAEYEITEPEAVDVRLGFIAANAGVPGQPFVAEDGRPGVHYELAEDDWNEVIFDSDAISWGV